MHRRLISTSPILKKITLINQGIQEPARFRKTRERKDMADVYLPAALQRMQLKKGETLVDFGCGPGALITKYLAPWAEKGNSSVIGVDLSEKMIEFCKTSSTHPSASYVAGDILSNNSPIQKNSLDKIFSVWVFQYIKDYGEIFKNFYELLKPGGQIWIMDGGDERYYKYFERVRTDPGLLKYIGGLDEHPLPEWYQKQPVEDYCKDKLLAAGFKILELETPTCTDEFDCIEDCIDVFTCSIPNSHNLSEDLRKKLNDICREEFVNWPGKLEQSQGQTGFSYQYKLFHLWAQK